MLTHWGVALRLRPFQTDGDPYLAAVQTAE